MKLELKTEKSQKHSVFNRGFNIMCWYVFFACILNPPFTMPYVFMMMCLSYTPVVFTITMSVGTMMVGMHGIEIMWDVLTGCRINVTKSNVPLSILEMKNRLEMVGTKIMTSPLGSVGSGTEQETVRR